MLNSFDKVVAEKGTKPDVANSVYRNLLKREREKAYQSIQEISQEISDLKCSFGDDNSLTNLERYLQSDKENINMQKQKENKKRVAFQKISFDDMIALQKNESFVNRCNKLSRIEDQQHKDQLQLASVQTPQFINNPFSSGASCQKPMTTKTQLPKLNLTELVMSQSSKFNIFGSNDSSGVGYCAFDKAVDSNRAVAFAYYTRRLLINGWKAFYNNRLELSNQRFYQRIGDSRHVKNQKKKIFKALVKHAKMHRGHAINRFRSTVVINQKLGEKYLRAWIQRYQKQSKRSQAQKYAFIQIRAQRKLVIFKQWKQLVVMKQMMQIQGKTSDHIYRQKYLQQSWKALKFFMNFGKKMRKQHKVSKAHYFYNLIGKTIQALQIWRVMSLKDREMRKMAEHLQNINLKKTVMRNLKLYLMNTQQFRKLQQCACNYYSLSLIKTALEVLKRNQLLCQGLRQQQFFVDTYYEKKLKIQFLRFIMATNMGFMEHEENVMNLMQRMQERRIFKALLDNKKNKRLNRLPAKRSFYYCSYQWLQHSFSKLNNKNASVNKGFEYPMFMNSSKVKYYQSAQANAKQQLKNYVLEKIFKAWKNENDQVKNLISKRNNKIMVKILRSLRIKSRQSAGHSFLLRRYLAHNKQNSILISFQTMLLNAKQKIKEREIVARYKEMREIKYQRQSFTKWFLRFKKETIKQHQKLASEEISIRKQLESSFYQWRTQFLQISKVSDLYFAEPFIQKRMLEEEGKGFMRKTIINKFFRNWVDQMKQSFELYKLDINLEKRNRIQTLQKVFRAFSVFKLIKTRKLCSIQMANEKSNLVLMNKAMSAWKVVGPEIRKKNSLYRIMDRERKLKLAQKFIKGLKMYYQYRLDKKTSDHFMTRAIQMIKMRQNIKKWHQLLSKRTGLQLLDYLFVKSRQREFYRRTARKGIFDEKVERHLKLVNMYKLVEFAFNHFKKSITQKRQWQQNALILKDVKKRQLKKEVLRYWKGTFKIQLWEEKLTYFSIIQIKNQIMKKYYQVLKANWQWKNLKVDGIKVAIKNKKKKMFNVLKKYGRSRHNSKMAYKYVTKQLRKKELKLVVNTWIGEIQDLMILRNLFELKRRQNMKKMIKSWKSIKDESKLNKKIVSEGGDIQNHFRLKSAMGTIKRFIVNSKIIKAKVSKVQELQSYNLQKQIINEVKDYIHSNKDEIKKSNSIKKKVHKRIIKSLWKKWSLQSEPRVVKVKVLKYLGLLQQKINLRKCIVQWAGYTIQGQQLDEQAETYVAMKKLQNKREAFQQLYTLKQRKNVSRQRDYTVSDYWTKKAQIRMLTLLRYATMLVQHQRNQNKRACQHLRVKTLQKSFYSLVYKTKRGIQLEYLKKQIERKRVQRYGPEIMEAFKQYTFAKQETKLQNRFAKDFYREKTNIKGFKAFLMNMMLTVSKRNRSKKAIVFHCENLIHTAFNAFRFGVCNAQIVRNKRKIFENTLTKVDTNTRLNLILQSLKENANQEKMRLRYMVGSICFNVQRRIFNELKKYYMKRKTHKKNALITKKKTQFSKLKKLMILWMRALTNEAKIKVVQRLRSKQCMTQSFNAIQQQLQYKHFINRNLNKKAQEYMEISFKSLQNYTLNEKRMRLIQSEIIYKDMENMKSKVFMSFKYEILIQKNLKMLQLKQGQELTTRAFNGWKYEITVDKASRQFGELRYRKEISSSFYTWLNLYKHQSTQRNLIERIANRKDLKMKFVSFASWKKDSFRNKLIEVLHQNIVAPHNQYIAKRCLSNWRRFTRLQNNKDLILSQVSSIRESLLARRVIREWYESSLKSMPGRILGQRLQQVITRLQMVKGLYLISEHAQNCIQHDEKLEYHTSNKEAYIVESCFRLWRKEYAVKELQRVMEMKRQRRAIKSALSALIQNKEENLNKKQIASHVVQNLDQLDLITQLRMTQTFQGWFLFKNKQMKKKQMKQDADSHYSGVLLTKHFYNMVDTYQGSQEDKVITRKAKQVWALKIKRHVMRALALNVLKERKYKQASMLYNFKIAEKAIYNMRVNIRQQKVKGNLNTKMMYFLKKKCISLFKETFTKWRVEYEHKSFAKRAVDEFDKFRNKNLMRRAFDYMVAILQQDLQFKDMTHKAKLYFERKNYLRTIDKVYFVLKENRSLQRQQRMMIEDQELGALKFYALKLMTKFLQAWKEETHSNRNRQARSKLYAVLSAWKFYTKERVLLKKYLKECNSVVDPNLLSTVEMRENVAKFSAVKSNFCESLSSGSPFMSAQRVLTPNTNVVNSTNKRGYSPYGY